MPASDFSCESNHEQLGRFAVSAALRFPLPTDEAAAAPGGLIVPSVPGSVASQLGDAASRRTGATVVLDPSGLFDQQAAGAVSEDCEIIRVSGWGELRCAWDLGVRRQPGAPHRLVVVRSLEFTTPTDLPWDIQHEAADVILLRRPVAVAGRPASEAADTDPEKQLTVLLTAQPALPDDLAGWFETASWWGQVRAAIAAQPTPPPGAEAAWQIWARLDDHFRAWLRNSYGSSLLSSAPHVALHRVAPHLARRLDDGAKVLLVVIDGLGFAQWHPLHRAAGLTVHQAGAALAMIPTLTSISRQAIFAGALPRDFAATLRTTSAEERLWRRFWKARGLPDGDISYTRTLGHDAEQLPALQGRAAAVVVNAVDDILHGADVLADRQVAAGVDLWARTGFLTNLVGAATADGYETWITSDHGNLPTVSSLVPREGQIVEQTGIRVRVYPNATLRARAADHGEIWDPPCLPTAADAAYHPLFAPGCTGYHTGPNRVSHGGISLDEVIVPVARVSE